MNSSHTTHSPSPLGFGTVCPCPRGTYTYAYLMGCLLSQYSNSHPIVMSFAGFSPSDNLYSISPQYILILRQFPISPAMHWMDECRISVLPCFSTYYIALYDEVMDYLMWFTPDSEVQWLRGVFRNVYDIECEWERSDRHRHRGIRHLTSSFVVAGIFK